MDTEKNKNESLVGEIFKLIRRQKIEIEQNRMPETEYHWVYGSNVSTNPPLTVNEMTPYILAKKYATEPFSYHDLESANITQFFDFQKYQTNPILFWEFTFDVLGDIFLSSNKMSEVPEENRENLCRFFAFRFFFFGTIHYGDWFDYNQKQDMPDDIIRPEDFYLVKDEFLFSKIYNQKIRFEMDSVVKQWSVRGFNDYITALSEHKEPLIQAYNIIKNPKNSNFSPLQCDLLPPVDDAMVKEVTNIFYQFYGILKEDNNVGKEMEDIDNEDSRDIIENNIEEILQLFWKNEYNMTFLTAHLTLIFIKYKTKVLSHETTVFTELPKLFDDTTFDFKKKRSIKLLSECNTNLIYPKNCKIILYQL